MHSEKNTIWFSINRENKITIKSGYEIAYIAILAEYVPSISYICYDPNLILFLLKTFSTFTFNNSENFSLKIFFTSLSTN